MSDLSSYTEPNEKENNSKLEENNESFSSEEWSESSDDEDYKYEINKIKPHYLEIYDTKDEKYFEFWIFRWRICHSIS